MTNVRLSTRTAPSAARLRHAAQGVLGLGIVFVILELAPRLELIPSRFFPPLTETFAELFRQLGRAEFWAAVGDTMSGWAIGLAIAAVAGIVLGLLAGSVEYIYRALRPIIEFLRPIPSVALIPLAILVFGSGVESKVFLVAIASTWPILVQTIYGSRDRDPIQLETAASYRIVWWQKILRITVPSTLPYIATGVRISSSVALILAVTAELVIGSPGLGQQITDAQAGGALPLMYALIITTGLLGLVINLVFLVIERRLLRWHPSQRGGSE
jgi:ABC-type nitrate/sulfonate/bicarbonate transport system permease component